MTETHAPPQTWDAEQYARNGRFVADLAGAWSISLHRERANAFSIWDAVTAR